jgi:HSP20 family molecular chaperone IbpA
MSEDSKRLDEKNPPRFRPATDILEREDGFYLYLDLPGVSREDLLLDVKDAELMVSGRTDYRFEPEERLLESEFGNVEYVCSFTLSDIVDAESVTANLRNGVLEIFIPKTSKTIPRRIQVEYQGE